MQAYPSPRPQSNPARAFTLEPQSTKEHKRLDPWVTTALAAIQPRVWDIARRLARVWTRNPNKSSGAHSFERWDRERTFAADLAHFNRIKGGLDAMRLPKKLRVRVQAVVHQVERLLHGATWWEPYRRVDARTGEVIDTLYLSEDTWSAAGAFGWCVHRLGILVAAAWGMTERVTPQSTPREAVKPPERVRSAQRDWNPAVDGPALLLRRAPPQPELPATG